jgi:DNA-binding GntR family transcriptional regulator
MPLSRTNLDTAAVRRTESTQALGSARPSTEDAEHNQSAVQRVIDVVLGRVRLGEYVPGQMIVTRDLMSELGLSKAPVREGIHVLVGEGVMELLPNRSARIRKLSTKDLLDFVEVWGVVGGLNLRLGSEHMDDPANRRRVAAALKAIQGTGRNRIPYDFFMAVANLHSTLADISANSYIRTIITRAHFGHFHRHVERIFPGAHWAEHLDTFKQAGEALLDGNGTKAEAIYRRHMGWVRDELKRTMEKGRLLETG